jgi:hypothetical protein
LREIGQIHSKSVTLLRDINQEEAVPVDQDGATRGACFLSAGIGG